MANQCIWRFVIKMTSKRDCFLGKVLGSRHIRYTSPHIHAFSFKTV